MHDDSTGMARTVAGSDAHRRRASYLYGLIVTGAVLAAAPTELRLVMVSLLVLGTLVVYWAAETYVHWIAARTVLQRGISRDERWSVVRDGWPLVAASAVPLLLMWAEAILQVETSLALDVALAVNAGLLFGVGFTMGKTGGLTGARLLLSVGATGLLGLGMIALKVTLH
jgi:hypothetical protein